MESPPSSSNSQTKSLNDPATDNTSSGLKEEVKLHEPEIITQPAEESRTPNLDEQTKDHVPQDLNTPVKFSTPQIIVEPPEESRPDHLNGQAKDSEPHDQPTQDLNEPNEDSKRPELHQFAPDSTAQDLKDEAEAQGDAPEKTSLDKDESPLPSSSEGEDATTTDDATAPKPSLDDNAALGLPEPATDHPPQTPNALGEPVTQGLEPRPLNKKETPSRIFMTGKQEKTIKTEKVEKAPSSIGDKRCYHACGHSSRSAKPMYSWSPPQLAKATLRPKPKPEMADKATQILPGRVPMLTKLPPKRVLIPKPKPPSADKATQISPSFEKLLKKPPPLLMKKKKKEETSPAATTRASPQATRSPSRRQSCSSHRGRSPRAAANSPPRRVKSSKSGPLRLKSAKSGSLRVKSAKSMPLRVKLSSTSPSKHRLNLSLYPRKKRKIICNLHINFYDNWEETKPCCVQDTHWEESLSSCSGIYRACSVFSMIKYGRIHMSNLLLALHTLGILVTSEEMHDSLRLINVDEHKSLNFCEFLEAVNTTSPFAEIEAFQNTLQAFRKMKKGTVTAKHLEPILQCLGITLSPETVQQTLGRTKVNKNGKFDISDFLLAAKDLQRILEEEQEEAFLNQRGSVSKRRPFQDVADLVDAEGRRRRKYCDCFEEGTPVPTRLFPLWTWQESAEDAALDKQQSRTSNMDLRRSSSASPVNITKEEAKGGDAMEVTTSRMGLRSDLKRSSPESLVNGAKGGNKDKDAMELRQPQVEPPSQNTADPVPPK